MSERITHTAIVDDTLRLAALSGTVCADFNTVAVSHKDLTRLGSITRFGDRHNPALLERIRDAWPKRTPEERLEERLAFVLGWLGHRAADRQMKPVFRALRGDDTSKPSECSVYHDAYIFNEVYRNTDGSPFGAEQVRPDTSADIRSLFSSLLSAALIEIHTFIPDESDVWGWLEKVSDLRQRAYVNLDRYDEAINHPDPEKTRRYITEGNFYNPEDPLLTVAAALRKGDKVSSSDIIAAADAEQESHYGQALQMSFKYLEAASSFFSGSISMDELKVRLKIGQKGSDGLWV